MATVATGAEPFQFVPVGSGQNSFEMESTANTFDDRISRYSLKFPTYQSVIELPFHSTSDEVWVHVRYRLERRNDSQTNMFEIANGAGTLLFALRNFTFLDFGGQSFQAVDHTGVISGSRIDSTTDVIHHLDIHYKKHAVDGRYAIYQNDSLLWEFNGDTSASAGSAAKLVLRPFNHASEFEYEYISQVFADDSDSTVGKRLITLIPEGAGTHSDWTGLFSDVDDLLVDTDDYIFTDATGQLQTFAFENVHLDFVNYDVDAVEITSINRLISTSVANDCRHLCLSGGTTYESADFSLAKDNALQTRKTLYVTNPDTAAQWTRTQVDAAQFGVKSI